MTEQSNLPAIRSNQLEEAGVVFLTKSLTQHDLDRHKELLGVELEVMSRKLDRFGWDQMDAMIRTRLRADWANALADFTLDEVRSACTVALAGRASDAMNEQRIVSIIQSRRSKIVAALPKPVEHHVERRPLTDEDRRIADDLVKGFAAKRFVGVA